MGGGGRSRQSSLWPHGPLSGHGFSLLLPSPHQPSRAQWASEACVSGERFPAVGGPSSSSLSYRLMGAMAAGPRWPWGALSRQGPGCRPMLGVPGKACPRSLCLHPEGPETNGSDQPLGSYYACLYLQTRKLRLGEVNLSPGHSWSHSSLLCRMRTRTLPS